MPSRWERSPSGAFSDPEGREPTPAPTPTAAPGHGPAALSEGRVLFVRDASILDAIRARQKRGRCAWCRKLLLGKQRVWCSGICRQEAYESSVLHDWAETRRAVLERDDFTCKACGRRGLSEYRDGGRPKQEWAEVDHIISVAEKPELQFDFSNLRTLCHPCHVESTKERRKAAAGPETAAKTAEALILEVGTKHTERVIETGGKTPKRLVEQIRAELLQNVKIQDVSKKYVVNQNVVKGIWSSLKAARIITQDAVPGQIVLEKPSAPPAEPAQPQQASQTPQPAMAQAMLAAQPQYAQTQGMVVTPPPQYDVVRRPNGGPEERPPAGGFPLTLDATGFVSKVYMNPKNLFWYDFWRKQHPEWAGDFADFISESIEFVFKTAGWELVARKTTRIS